MASRRSICVRNLFCWFALLCWLAGMNPAKGADSSMPDSTALLQYSEELSGPGTEVFARGKFQTGFLVGAGLGTPSFGSTVAHHLALASLHVGWMVTDILAENESYRGNWELIGELFGGVQFDPEARYLVGVTPLLRYNFVTRTRWVPFVTAGVGVCITDIGRPDLSGLLQFNPQAGFGTHYFLGSHTALTAEWRWLHISNSGVSQPNHGVNTQMFTAGMAWFF